MSADSIFNLSEDELKLVKTKKSKKNQLIFAVMLKYFQLEGRFPKHIKFVDPLMLQTIANQLNVRASIINNVDWEGRSTERYRWEIRGFLGYRQATEKDIDALKSWLMKEVFPLSNSRRIN